MRTYITIAGFAAVCSACLLAALVASTGGRSKPLHDPTETAMEIIGQMMVRPGDWPQWAGTGLRNNTPGGYDIPTDWDVNSRRNIKWVGKLGSQTYGNPVIANGKVYVGTNNGAGYLERYSDAVDLGCLLCFDEATGKFLWQHSSEKLPTGSAHDWPLQGICCAPYAEGDRVWFVTSRGEVVCLDSKGFYDEKNDGPFKAETHANQNEADVVWKYDMMAKLGISQHNMCSCSVTCAGELLFVNTSNGVDESHIDVPAPKASSFVCMDRDTGQVVWTDRSPGINILHGQWSSPACGVLGGVHQVLFPGGDGWLYSFEATPGEDRSPKLLWKFDCNRKESKWKLGGRGTRNNLIGTPTIYDGLVYMAVGQDPQHGEGIGHLWCINPTERGDVSPELAVDGNGNIMPHRRIQAVLASRGETAKPNPNSAAVWDYSESDSDGNGKVEFDETMHRTCGTAAIKNDLLFIADFSGLVHCVDAKTGEPHWTYDMLAAAWGSALIVDGHVYVGDEDGDVTIFKLSKEMEVVKEIMMNNSVYTTPVVANNVLYISNRTHLYAISNNQN